MIVALLVQDMELATEVFVHAARVNLVDQVNHVLFEGVDVAEFHVDADLDLVLDTKAICDASATVGRFLGTRRGMDDRKSGLVSLLIEETLMLVKDRNAGRRTHAEISVGWSNGITVVIRDDGKLFDITDADSTASSLRSYLVANLMVAIPARRNMTTTGFNRNMFKL